MGADPASGRARASRLPLLAYGVAAAVVVLDQLSKWWILEVARLPERGQIPVLPFFELTMVWNRGVSFGLLQAGEAARWLLVAFAFAVVIALLAWVRRVDRKLVAVGLGLIIGGAIGNNLIDRIRFGAVADFLDFSGLWFPWVFNVADSAITVGVILLLLDGVLPRRAS